MGKKRDMGLRAEVVASIAGQEKRGTLIQRRDANAWRGMLLLQIGSFTYTTGDPPGLVGHIEPASSPDPLAEQLIQRWMDEVKKANP